MERIFGKWSHWALSDKGHHIKFFTHKSRAFPLKLEKHDFNGLIIYTFWRIALFLDYRQPTPQAEDDSSEVKE